MGQLPAVGLSIFMGLWLIGMCALVGRVLQLHLRYKNGAPAPPIPPPEAREPLERLYLCLKRAYTAEAVRRSRIHSFGYTLLFACSTMSTAPAFAAYMGFFLSDHLQSETTSGNSDEWFASFIFAARGCCILAPILILRPTDRRALHIVLATILVMVIGIIVEVRSLARLYGSVFDLAVVGLDCGEPCE